MLDELTASLHDSKDFIGLLRQYLDDNLPSTLAEAREKRDAGSAELGIADGGFHNRYVEMGGTRSDMCSLVRD